MVVVVVGGWAVVVFRQAGTAAVKKAAARFGDQLKADTVTLVEVWDRRTGQNISRHIEYPSGEIVVLKSFPPEYKSVVFFEEIESEKAKTD